MNECLLCKRDMKKAKTVFGTGCIKSIYKLLDLEMPKKSKEKEKYLYKSIMTITNKKSLNANQKVWLADRYLTYKYLENLHYGDFEDIKIQLNSDIENISEVNDFSMFATSSIISLKDAYLIYKREQKFNKNLDKLKETDSKDDLAMKLILATFTGVFNIKKDATPFEISAFTAMQYDFWKVVAAGGRIVGFDFSADLLEHSLKEDAEDIVVTDGEIIEKIKNDEQFKEKIKTIIQDYGKNTKEFTTYGKNLGVEFDNSDLYFSIHGADIIVVGKKANEKWNLSIELIDKYDYTDFKEYDDYYNDANSIPKSMFSSFIYNLAYFSVKLGVLKTYKVHIKFDINDYEL